METRTFLDLSKVEKLDTDRILNVSYSGVFDKEDGIEYDLCMLATLDASTLEFHLDMFKTPRDLKEDRPYLEEHLVRVSGTYADLLYMINTLTSSDASAYIAGEKHVLGLLDQRYFSISTLDGSSKQVFMDFKNNTNFRWVLRNAIHSVCRVKIDGDKMYSASPNLDEMCVVDKTPTVEQVVHALHDTENVFYEITEHGIE